MGHLKEFREHIREVQNRKRIEALDIIWLGNSFAFCYSLDDWTARGILREKFPCLFSIAHNPQANVGACWNGMWNTILYDTSSDQRLE